MRMPEDIGDAIQQINKLRIALQLILDHIDYTQQACSVTEMIGACLPKELIDRAHKALDDTK